MAVGQDISDVERAGPFSVDYFGRDKKYVGSHSSVVQFERAMVLAKDAIYGVWSSAASAKIWDSFDRLVAVVES